MLQKERMVAGRILDESSSAKKKQTKVPKKIHKSEREKLKRDNLNVFFLKLGQTLEPTQQNNGKASILGDACKILRHLTSQVENLKKEHVALLSETRYVTAENQELKDETAALGAEIKKLQNEVRDRLCCNPPRSNNVIAAAVPSIPQSDLLVQQQTLVEPLYVIPLHHNLQSSPEAGIIIPETDPCPQVRKPQARYPTPDSWPNNILPQQHKAFEARDSVSSSAAVDRENEKSSQLELSLQL